MTEVERTYNCCEHCEGTQGTPVCTYPDEHTIPCKHGCNDDEDMDSLGSSNA